MNMKSNYSIIKECLVNLDTETLMKIVQEAKLVEPEDAPDLSSDSVTEAVVDEMIDKLSGDGYKNNKEARYYLQILMMTEAAFRWHDYQLTINSVAH